MPCVCGVDRTFVDQVLSPTYGNVEVPVRYNKIFTAADYVDPSKEKTLNGSRSINQNKENQIDKKLENVEIETIETKDGLVPIT